MIQVKEGVQHKSGIEVEEFRIWRELQIDDGTYKWFISVGYVVLTLEGERIKRDRTLELIGKQATDAVNLRTWIVSTLTTEEGIT